MVAVKAQCPKCGSPRLYEEKHHDGTDHYCLLCGFRKSYDLWEEPGKPKVGEVVEPVAGQTRRRYVKECEECGRRYTGSGQSHYCSNPCRRRGYKKKQIAARAA